MRADDKVEYEEADGTKGKEKYSNFEFLQTKVEILQEQLDVLSKILKENGMTKITEEYDMNIDYDDETCKKLEKD